MLSGRTAMRSAVEVVRCLGLSRFMQFCPGAHQERLAGHFLRYVEIKQREERRRDI